MAFIHISGVTIKGISACIPKLNVENKDYSGFTSGESEKIIAAIGVERHRMADQNTCASDLCFQAAERLIHELSWKKEEIDCLIFVSQTPDYILPATACLLQTRLGLRMEIAAFDISLGCSGWIYGLQVISSLLSHGYLRKGLLLVSETILKYCSEEDKSTFPLFGDAGAATALEYDKHDPGFKFHLGTDGTGYDALYIPDGGFRNQVSESSLEFVEIKPGIKRSPLQLVLNGMDILSFSISKAPESILMLSERFEIDLNTIDFFLLHQANRFINERIRNKLALPSEKVPYSLQKYGNTGPATIPLTMVSELSEHLRNNKTSILACGFGAGLSWGSVYFCTDKLICSEIIEI
jgi:3-oxoacyl-[acyl-carrier-protein] synthase III